MAALVGAVRFLEGAPPIHRCGAFDALFSSNHWTSARLLPTARGLGSAAIHGQVGHFEPDDPIVNRLLPVGSLSNSPDDRASRVRLTSSNLASLLAQPLRFV